MPITRRKRATPPDQPENNNHLADQSENSTEALTPERSAGASAAPIETEHTVDTAPPVSGRPEDVSYEPSATTPPPALFPPSLPSSLSSANGERLERSDRAERAERGEYSSIEGGRRTARGELFRRPPQPPPQPVTAPSSLQPPSHEIKLPLGKEPGDALGDPLHLAYNPSYTGADGARSSLLQKLADESKAGGRARCWNCGSLAIVYDRWSTRSKTFGEVGVAFCEICGVWSVM